MTSTEKEVSLLRDRLATIKPGDDGSGLDSPLSKMSQEELVEKYAQIKGGIPINFNETSDTYMNRLSPLIEHDEMHHLAPPTVDDDFIMQEPSQDVSCSSLSIIKVGKNESK